MYWRDIWAKRPQDTVVFRRYSNRVGKAHYQWFFHCPLNAQICWQCKEIWNFFCRLSNFTCVDVAYLMWRAGTQRRCGQWCPPGCPPSPPSWVGAVLPPHWGRRSLCPALSMCSEQAHGWREEGWEARSQALWKHVQDKFLTDTRSFGSRRNSLAVIISVRPAVPKPFWPRTPLYSSIWLMHPKFPTYSKKKKKKKTTSFLQVNTTYI